MLAETLKITLLTSSHDPLQQAQQLARLITIKATEMVAAYLTLCFGEETRVTQLRLPSQAA
ncbi:hypothetical protein A3741_24325 [Oleiphilus sp. HI0069]|jgi:hypothetical protein|nr:hypothetical protein A3741_24325 [Oleiphilus sp. HI0069]